MQGEWPKTIRDRWFLGLLMVTIVGVVSLFRPYLYVLGSAAVVVIVTWPLYERVLARCHGRRSLAAGLTLAGLVVAVFGPIGVVLYIALGEAVGFAHLAADALQDDQIVQWLEGARAQIEQQPFIESALAFLPVDFDPVSAIWSPLQDGAVKLLKGMGSSIPTLLASAWRWSLDAVIFLFAVVALYADGPRAVDAVKRLSPIDDAYEDHLFGVFAEFANNMVIGSLATGVVQGIVAGIGYLIVGVPSSIFLAILTAVLSFVPLVGTAAVWIPVVIWTWVNHGTGWALFLAIWSVVLTGGVDNVLKPIFLRGNSNIHPLLVFVSVFAGLSSFGLPGVLMGPVVVALAVSMYRIYVEDFLGEGGTPPEALAVEQEHRAEAEQPVAEAASTVEAASEVAAVTEPAEVDDADEPSDAPEEEERTDPGLES